MRIVSHKKLKEFYETKGCEDSRIALERWYHMALKAEWTNFSDVKADFPATDYTGNQHYVFNIKGNNYRLVVVIKFTIGYIYIRFVGSHKEYDKIDCSTI
jgi:mRNA interferase HigB